MTKILTKMRKIEKDFHTEKDTEKIFPKNLS